MGRWTFRSWVFKVFTIGISSPDRCHKQYIQTHLSACIEIFHPVLDSIISPSNSESFFLFSSLFYLPQAA